VSQVSIHALAADNEGIDKNANVSQYELWTRLTVMKKTKKATRFTRWTIYELKDREGEWNKVMCILARSAEYANIGEN
jgi:hypothetical protein